MAFRQDIPKFPFNVPWFMYDLFNRQLITSATIPGDITDTKPIVLAETPIPGLNYDPITPAGGGSRKLSFTIMLVRRNNTIGNVAVLRQIEALRNQTTGLLGKTPGQFSPAPQVLYYWGVGSVPQVYWVAKADPRHKAGWVNQFGQPQVSEIDFELILDETHPLYQAEQTFRQLVPATGAVQNQFDLVNGIVARAQRLT